MALIKLLGYEHLTPSNSVGNVNNCWGLQYSGLSPKAWWSSDIVSYPNIAHLRIEGNVIQFGSLPNAVSNGAGMATIPLLNLIGNISPSKLIIGFRVNKVAQGLAAYAIFNLGTLPAPSVTSGTQGTNLLMFNLGDALGSAYYEIEFNFTAGTYNITKDGAAFVASTALPGGVTAATIKNYYWSMGRFDTYLIGSAPIVLHTLSDIYVVADTGISGDTVVSRLGDTIVKRATLASATGSWIASDGGQIPDKLNAKRTSTTLQFPNISSPSDMSELRLKINTDPLAGATLKGVYVGAAVGKDYATPGSLAGKVSRGGTDSAAQALLVATTSTPSDQKVAAITAMPDGSAFTIANLANLEIVITPTA